MLSFPRLCVSRAFAAIVLVVLNLGTLSLLSACLPTQAQTPHAWNVTYTNTGIYSYADRDQPTTGQSTAHTTNWPPTSNGGGGGSSTVINGNSQGKVTATLTWIPASGKTLLTDPPPTPVTLIEYGYAREESISAPGPAGSADNGLGDMEIPYSSGFVSQGYHALSPQDGSSGTITVVSPLLKAINPVSHWVSYPNFPGYHSWDWTAGECTASFTVYPVTINLAGSIPDSSGNPSILVGQGCTASLVGVPASCTVSNYNWSVSGTTFQSWSPTTPANPNATPPTPANPSASYFVGGYGPANQATANWYWNDLSKTTETITCVATVTPPSGASFPVTLTQKVTVQVPAWTAYGAGGYMQVNAGAPNSGGATCLYAGRVAGQQGGMNWTATCTTPQTSVAFGTGTIELVQLVTPNMSYYNNLASLPHYDPKHGQTGLDTVYPYPGPAYTEGSLLSPAYQTNDSPSLPLANTMILVAMQHQFTDYLLYLPPSAGNGIQWVPRATFAWSTNGSAAIPTTNSWADYAAQHGGSDAAGTVNPNVSTAFTSGNAFPSWGQIISGASESLPWP